MRLKCLFGEEKAVSPVIGVILMVAITVILAAVIGSFVLGIGGNQNVAPQASWSGSDEGGTPSVTFEHDGGESISASELAVSLNGTTVRLADSEFSTTSDPVTASNSVVVKTDTSLTASDFANENTARLIWEDPNSDDSQILAEHTLNNQ